MATPGLAAFSEALARHTRAEDARRDSRLLLQPYANWEEMLLPAPAAIAILGELMAVSAGLDFGLEPGRLRQLRHPDSFRACLQQVSNEGWTAFSLAHSNMDQIRLQAASVPVHMKAAVHTLLRGDRPTLLRLLPRQLGCIRAAADECRELAHAADQGFVRVSALVHELLEACAGARGARRAEAEAAREALEEAERRRVRAEAERQRAAEWVERAGREVDDASRAWQRAEAREPGPWAVLGLHAAECTITSVSGLLSGLLTVSEPVAFSGAILDTLGALGSAVAERIRSKGGPDSRPGPGVPASPASPAVLAASARLLLAAFKLQELLTPERQLLPTALHDPQPCAQAQQLLDGVQAELEAGGTEEEEDEEEGGPGLAALALCRHGLRLCQRLQELHPSPEAQQLEQAAASIHQLHCKVMRFNSGCAASCPGPALAPGAPNLSGAAKGQEPADRGLLHTMLTQARVKVETAKTQLETSRQEYRRGLEVLQERDRELEELLQQMRGCRVKELDLGDTLVLLAQGLRALGQVQEQWAKLIRFFQMMSNLIKVCLSKTLVQLAEQAEDVQELENYSQQQLVRDLIYSQAFQASNISGLVHTIASTYMDVSNKYLMDRITQLGRLVTLEPGDADFAAQRHLLHQGCDQARKMIMQRALSSQQDFERQVQLRIEAIDSDMAAALPPAPAHEQQLIESSLKEQPSAIFHELSHYEEEQWA
ncbi:uncharacterized protein LOC129699825 [Leucoraja erinacea]|uniref:uncharacterized protein LOC129699825 n=1 Tax=Leucoraja erinaceus TaxID=7782 RepID=UPI002455209E|nr:uncharacterized protein LOC129699825 [Leucoraja erinacea]